MTKTIKECLEQIDYFIYSKHISKNTLISQESMHKFISVIVTKEQKSITGLLNSILLQAEQPSNLLTHKGLMNILIENYPNILLDYAREEKARQYTCYADE